MKAEVGVAYVSIAPSMKGFAKKLEREVTGATGGLQQTGEQAGGKVAKGVGSGIKRNLSAVKVAAVAMGAVIVAQVGGAMVQLAKSSVTAASDLGESINAVTVTFGDAANEVLKLGENAVQTVGLSRKEFNDLAVQFASFAETIAGDGGDVVGTLDDLTRRAADFASVMNMDVAEAAALFQSTLAGESEPMRRYGEDFSAAAVTAYAYANGIGTAGVELTETEKVQARYMKLMEDTQKVQGDFINTGDGYANSQRKLRAEWENQKAVLGEALLPLLAQLADKFREILPDLTEFLIPAFEWFGEKAVGALQWVIDNWDRLKQMLYTVKETITQVFSYVAQNWQAFAAAAAAVSALRVAFMLLNITLLMNPITWLILGVIAVVAGLAYAIKELWDNNEEFRNSVKQLWEDIKNLYEENKPTFEKIKQAWEDIKDAMHDAFDWFMEDVWPELKNWLPEVFKWAAASAQWFALSLKFVISNLQLAWELLDKMVGGLKWIVENADKLKWVVLGPVGAAGLEAGEAIGNRHEGGAIGGAGDVPIVAQSGEFVLSRSMVAQMGMGSLEAWRQGGAMPGGFNVENLVINNPTPERASESLPRAIRNLTYMAGA